MRYFTIISCFMLFVGVGNSDEAHRSAYVTLPWVTVKELGIDLSGKELAGKLRVITNLGKNRPVDDAVSDGDIISMEQTQMLLRWAHQKFAAEVVGHKGFALQSGISGSIQSVVNSPESAEEIKIQVRRCIDWEEFEKYLSRWGWNIYLGFLLDVKVWNEERQTNGIIADGQVLIVHWEGERRWLFISAKLVDLPRDHFPEER